MMTEQTARDGALAGGAISSPLWLDALTTYGQAATIMLGLVLLVLTIVLRVKEIKRDGKTNSDRS